MKKLLTVLVLVLLLVGCGTTPKEENYESAEEILAQVGLLEEVRALHEGNLDLTKEEARAAWDRASAAITQLEAEKGKLEAIHGDERLMTMVQERVESVNAALAEARSLLTSAGRTM